MPFRKAHACVGKAVAYALAPAGGGAAYGSMAAAGTSSLSIAREGLAHAGKLEAAKARDELRGQVAAIALTGAQQLLERELSPADHQAMLDKRLNYTCGYWREAKTLDEAF